MVALARGICEDIRYHYRLTGSRGDSGAVCGAMHEESGFEEIIEENARIHSEHPRSRIDLGTLEPNLMRIVVCCSIMAGWCSLLKAWTRDTGDIAVSQTLFRPEWSSSHGVSGVLRE